jgi:hypothetical protein
MRREPAEAKVRGLPEADRTGMRRHMRRGLRERHRSRANRGRHPTPDGLKTRIRHDRSTRARLRLLLYCSNIVFTEA